MVLVGDVALFDDSIGRDQVLSDLWYVEDIFEDYSTGPVVDARDSTNRAHA